MDRLKRDDETWDVFFDRIIPNEQRIEVGSWSDEQAEQTKQSIKNSRMDW
ncbi:MAG: hypothetical protein ACOC0Z_08740 [Halohasta sp.]